MGFFPVDGTTIDYLRLSGRDDATVDLVERYCKAQGLWRDPTARPRFSRVLALDLGSVTPSLAGPKRPQDRIALADMKTSWQETLGDRKTGTEIEIEAGDRRYELDHGAVVIAAITSCTNTSNPSVMIAAGLLARAAVERGLEVPPWVKTSLAPGSRVVTDYLERAGLTPYLERLGFHTVGYGCTTCIGNSGPLPEPIQNAVRDHDLVVASVLSGNRNFEGRVNPWTRANYLASPPLVVAYALAGTVDVDLVTEPIGTDTHGTPVSLREIWPSSAQIQAAIAAAVSPEQYRRQYADVFTGPAEWRAVEVSGGDLYDWDPRSTYIRKPPFFESVTAEVPAIESIRGARALAVLGDTVTTDHISPAGAIPADSPAARYLNGHGIERAEFNSFGSRRGNHEVMMRGTFGNIRLRNLLVPGIEGGVTEHLPSGERLSIYDAAMRYADEGTPLVVLAGREYGTGSSRDWAAKGTNLLGVRAVIAASFERIHRSNLVGMGVLPLQLADGESIDGLGLTGREHFDVDVPADLTPRQQLEVRATADDGTVTSFDVTCRVDTPVEVDYYRNGGILHAVLRRLATR
jgi:aconitate hydratase